MKSVDGRWFLGGHHLSLLFISMAFYNLQRSYFQIISAFAAAVAVETLLYFFTEKNKSRKFLDVALSSATNAAGVLVLVKSTYSWFYIPLSIVAVASKYAFKKTNSTHMFNPTNFAIVVMFALLPRQYFELRGDEFNISFYPMAHVFLFGVFAVYFGKTWRVTVSYLVSILIFSWLVSVFHAESFIYLLGPEISAIGLLFMFLMITDPKTCPATNHGQIVFGSAIAAVLYSLRMKEYYYAHYLSLFIVVVGRGIYILIKDHIFRKNPAPSGG